MVAGYADWARGRVDAVACLAGVTLGGAFWALPAAGVLAGCGCAVSVGI